MLAEMTLVDDHIQHHKQHQLPWCFYYGIYHRAGHYIFSLWFLSVFFIPSFNLSSHRLDV